MSAIDQYSSILVEWNLEGLGCESYIFFYGNRDYLFRDFLSYLKNTISLFINHHSEEFAFAEYYEWCEQYPELGLDPEDRNFDDLLKIINHVIEKVENAFIMKDNVDIFFTELDDLFDWISNIPSYPNRDFIHIPIKGNYPDFIEMWYGYETRSPMLPSQYDKKISDSAYNDEDATILGWICMLLHSENWYDKPDAVKFISQLVDRFNRRHEFN